MKIFSLDQIQSSISIVHDIEALIDSQKAAFIGFSSGLYDVPLPMQFIFSDQASDCHIKGGYRKSSKNFVIKVAGSCKSGNNGSILVFDAENCELKAILQDKGFLTTLRTAIAGMLCLALMPWKPKNIGIIGSGSVAGQLYELAHSKYSQSNIMLYARNKVKAAAISDLICDSVEDLVKKCDVVFTATSSPVPMIHDISHNKEVAIILLGSDDEHKSEIAPWLFKKADIVIIDSKTQAVKFGDISRALSKDCLDKDDLIELGEALKSGTCLKAKKIIADLSGIGAQDVAITEFIFSKITEN
jgi:ornithine cyclodeaminase